MLIAVKHRSQDQCMLSVQSLVIIGSAFDCRCLINFAARFSLQNLGKFGTNTMQEHSARIHANDTSRNDYQSLDDGDEDWSSKCSRCFQIFKSLRIEPVMFLFMFSFILNSTCLTNMIMEKGCLYYLNYSKEICSNLSYYKDQRDSVEILANNYNLYLDMLAPIGATVVIFLAPWSDKYGRKPPLILALFGFFVNDVGIILCTIYFYSALEYIILSSLATQLTGGFIAVMTVIYSHSSEVSSAASRSQKYTYLQIAFGIAVTLGALAGGQLYRYYGYTVVYSTMASGHLMAILWVIIFVPETAGLDSNVSFWHKMRDLCSSQNFTSGFKSTLKHRDNNGRTRLWFLLLSSCTVAITYEGNIFGFLNGLANLAVRSLISKLVDKEELGRVFSFLATCEAIVPLMASGIIAKVFNATIRTFPGACFLVATVFLMLPLGTFVWQLKYRVPREDSALKEA
ncbi:proton-coupled folate transporter-like isoform X4 [Stegodyphus dumicola]|uniref:proton-coupled folate transporter-like isoform X4 n=1 Tax=Stegodyphus dumicola TaxID=202533 RepID=UPI0015A952EC|nr:proton-coupled folate transporter-like isoform X4 [Stegodyphus dumicola]